MIDSKLNRRQVRALQEIFKHPVSHNLEWSEVFNLVEHLGSALERHDGKYEFQIGTLREVFTKPHHKDIDPAEVVRLRKFLTEAGVSEAALVHARLVLVVDHRSARFFEPQTGGGHLVERDHLEPMDPHGFERHLEHRKEADYEGQRVPEATEFYERIAARLKDAGPIVLVGDATGNSSALTYLTQFLERKHEDVWQRVVATERADLSAITVARLEQIDQLRA